MEKDPGLRAHAVGSELQPQNPGFTRFRVWGGSRFREVKRLGFRA